MSIKGQLLQDPFLSALQREQIPVSMFLVNGIKLLGHVESFDQYVVVLKGATAQMVFKHAISTIVPARKIDLFAEVGGETREDSKEAKLPAADTGDKSPQVTVKRTRARSIAA